MLQDLAANLLTPLAIGFFGLCFALFWIILPKNPQLANIAAAFICFAPAVSLSPLFFVNTTVYHIAASTLFMAIGFVLLDKAMATTFDHKPDSHDLVAAALLFGLINCTFVTFQSELKYQVITAALGYMVMFGLFTSNLVKGKNQNKLASYIAMSPAFCCILMLAYALFIMTSGETYTIENYNTSMAFVILNYISLCITIVFAAALLAMLTFDTVNRLIRERDLDDLTGLSKRGIFEEHAAMLMTNSRQAGHAMTMMILDIDHFKNVNDTLGHPVGDKAIIALTAVINNNIRRNDVACRMGGEEFGIILAGCSEDDALPIAEKIRTQFASTAIEDFPEGRFCTISIGLTELREDDDFHNLYQRTDKMLYCAKNAGRNRVVSRLPDNTPVELKNPTMLPPLKQPA